MVLERIVARARIFNRSHNAIQNSRAPLLALVCLLGLALNAIGQTAGPSVAPVPPGRLFPPGMPHREWREFAAAGYARPVWGTIYGADRKPECGVPLGGLGTGCLDIEADGQLGYCTCFSHVWGHGDGSDGGRKYRDRIVDRNGRVVDLNDPSRGPLNVPFLGLAVGNQSWVLAAPAQEIGSVRAAREIEYWGHYPVADSEFKLDGPVNVGVRAWSPFLPGDTFNSSLPGAMFEVHLRNGSDQPQAGALVMSFPGPRERETRGGSFTRRTVDDENLKGVWVATERQIGYVLAALDVKKLRTGGGLGTQWTAWSHLDSTLPHSGTAGAKDGSASVAVDFQLNPHEIKVIRFVLAWYAPEWEAGWGESKWFTRMYAVRHPDALHVARQLARNHERLLRAVLAWQQSIYAEEKLPGWLRDGLVNILHLIAEESYWGQSRGPLSQWPYPDGLFSLVEGTDADGQQTCLPCDWYGNLPVVYFFPELARNTLRAVAQRMREDGCVPMTVGKGLDLIGDPQYPYQHTLNPCVFVDLVDRLWSRTGDESVLKEFYAAVKKTTVYVMNLVPGPAGVISNTGPEWYESFSWPGLCSHVGGVRLAHLRLVERMAEKIGDRQFTEQCRTWYAQGSRALADLWAGTHYLIYRDPASGKKSDLILAHQLDGEWIADFHGVPGVFPPEHVAITLATIKRKCSPLTESGLLVAAECDGRPTTQGGRMGEYCTMPASAFITAMNYAYEGDQQSCREIVFQCLNNLVNAQGMTWDMPNMVRGDRGQMRRIYGFDYYQCMSLWGVPASLAGEDIAAACKPGGLVDRILRAARQSASGREQQ